MRSNDFRNATKISGVMSTALSTVLFASLSLAVLGGCSTLSHPVAIDWEHGARRGTVTQVYDSSTPGPTLPGCLARLPATERALHRYAEIDYRHVRHMFREVGELPAGVDAVAGDAVEFLPQNCQNGSLSIIVRVLPDAAS